MYGTIVASAGYSWRKLLDRMIAAQALVHRATLVTFNPGDSPMCRPFDPRVVISPKAGQSPRMKAQ